VEYAFAAFDAARDEGRVRAVFRTHGRALYNLSLLRATHFQLVFRVHK
jgi:hypothetical protein